MLDRKYNSNRDEDLEILFDYLVDLEDMSNSRQYEAILFSGNKTLEVEKKIVKTSRNDKNIKCKGVKETLVMICKRLLLKGRRNVHGEIK